MIRNNYMTPPCFHRLSEELTQLLQTERPQVTQLVQWAASNGDRSENADYLYGKRRLREIDRRIRFLSQRLDASVVIEPAEQNSEKIQFGATVLIQDEERARRTITIVGVDEVDTTRGRLSWQSPIGKSLIGKEVGDEVVVLTPTGEKSFEVIDVSYRPSSP
jgi:transcription elongation factor GreB